MRNRLILSSLILVFSVLKVSAQYYDTGQDPASLKWMQIKTGRFTVIYPGNYGTGGQDYAKALEEAYTRLITIFPEKKIKIPVIIHNHSIRSNGYVAWAPKRMELYPSPEQNGIPLAPRETTCSSRTNSCVSDGKSESGLYKGNVISIRSAGDQESFPLYFLCGFLKAMPYSLSRYSRHPEEAGTAAFQKHLKAIITEGSKKYKYDKILNGSYRDFIPDYYESGYQMVTWAMLKSDPQIWNKAFRYTGSAALQSQSG